VTLPASVGQRFEPQEQVLESASSQIHAPIEDDEEDDDDEEDEDEDEDDPENNW
jgi:hypothetical protein